MSTVKPIQTEYQGCHFRSRLEARWAVFFDAMGIRWQYEVEGYKTPDGLYLPDFWLPELEYVVEIKPTQPGEIEQSKLKHVGKYLDAKGAFIATQPITAIHGAFQFPAAFVKVWPFWDCDYVWCRCQECGRLEMQFEGRSDRMACKKLCRKSEHGDRGHTSNDVVLARAYARATMARFEHGETPCF